MSICRAETNTGKCNIQKALWCFLDDIKMQLTPGLFFPPSYSFILFFLPRDSCSFYFGEKRGLIQIVKSTATDAICCRQTSKIFERNKMQQIITANTGYHDQPLLFCHEIITLAPSLPKTPGQPGFGLLSLPFLFENKDKMPEEAELDGPEDPVRVNGLAPYSSAVKSPVLSFSLLWSVSAPLDFEYAPPVFVRIPSSGRGSRKAFDERREAVGENLALASDVALVFGLCRCKCGSQFNPNEE